jgi:predicted O-methyltransferase YrrM
MKFKDVRAELEGIPFMEPDRAETLYEFIIKNELCDCLELGFAHGVGSCYVAAALDELGRGSLTSVDLIAAQEWQKPSIEQLLAKTGLKKYVTVVREQTSYTWYLKKMIEASSSGRICQPTYDLCFIDGPKNWTIDGCAFFLVDKLLRKNGWIIFDDYSWKYSEFGEFDVIDGISLRTMGKDELTTPHIELVFQLLVMQHPSYSNFRIEDNCWAWAQKVADPFADISRENNQGSAQKSMPNSPIRKLLGKLSSQHKEL